MNSHYRDTGLYDFFSAIIWLEFQHGDYRIWQIDVDIEVELFSLNDVTAHNCHFTES